MKRFSIKAAIIAVSGVIAAAASCGNTYTVRSAEDAAGFLSSRGVEVSGTGSCKTVTLPAEFGDVYERYNELQKQAGYDLSKYASREAEVYTFRIVSVGGQPSDYTEAHVMVCDSAVIGGDLASLSPDGDMIPLPDQLSN